MTAGMKLRERSRLRSKLRLTTRQINSSVWVCCCTLELLQTVYDQDASRSHQQQVSKLLTGAWWCHLAVCRFAGKSPLNASLIMACPCLRRPLAKPLAIILCPTPDRRESSSSAALVLCLIGAGRMCISNNVSPVKSQD